MADKSKIAMDFASEYTQLLESEKNNFARIACKLLGKTFVLRDEEQSDYYAILENQKVYENYFAVIEYQVIISQEHGIAHIETIQNRNRVRFSKFETALILILRKSYHEKKKQASSFDEIVVKLEDIIREVETSQIYNEVKKISAYKEALEQLRKYNIINYTATKISSEMDIVILPSILVILPQDNIEEIISKLNNLKKDNQNNMEDIVDEENDED